MKNINLISVVLIIGCFFISFTSCSQDFKKLDDDKIEKKSFKIASGFIEKFYSKLNTGSHYEFGEEAIDAVKNSMTPEAQKNIYKQVKDQFGEFKSAEYVETWVQNANPDYKIMRYKGNFADSSTKLEIRVVLNDEDKIAGFFIKPWSDMLN